MPSDPAEARPGSEAGRPRWWAAGLVLCVLLALVTAGAVLHARQPQDAVLPGRDGGPRSAEAAQDREALRADEASKLLGELTRRLRVGSRQQVAALAPPGDEEAVRELRALYGNVRALRITDLGLRYVDEHAAGVDARTQHPLGAEAWVAQVQLSWRLADYDADDSRVELPMAFRLVGEQARFVTARLDAGEQPTPLWLLEKLSVRRTGGSLVAAADASVLRRFSRLAAQASRDVRKVLTRWRGRLVVEVPSRQRVLARVLGSTSESYAGIAAVTTTADGSLVPGSPVHVFVNPRVFAPLGPRGSQIVMSHEATHVATRAATSSMPTWLLEGFADYVALAHAELPVSVTASQILARVRKQGPPKQLPGPTEFAPGNKLLGTSYEAAWLACRLLARTYGEDRLIEFYRASDRASSTTGTFRSVLGTSGPAFTRSWRAELRRLAG